MGGTLKRLSLTFWIFVGMAAGVAVGAFAPSFAPHLEPVSQIFLRLIRSIIALAAISPRWSTASPVRAISSRWAASDLKAIVYFEIVTTLALFLGLGAVNLVRPGAGVPIAPTAAETALPAAQSGFKLENIVPTSIVDAMARNDALQIVVFAFLFGAACSAIGAKADPVVKFCGSLAEVMFRFTRYVMYMAPIGRGRGHRHHHRQQGSQGAVRPGPVDRHHVRFCGAVHSAGAAAGAPALPHSDRQVLPRGAGAVPDRLFHRVERSGAAAGAGNMEEFGVPKHIVGFVIPTGYSFNLVGSALYLSLASIFRGASRGHASHYGRAVGHDADPHADQQGRGREFRAPR
jgi:proton glutamate symport protein